MQPRTEDRPEMNVPVAPEPEDLPPVQDPAARAREEITMLLIGFGTGMSIAAVFLVYLVFEYAKWLP